ncbi:malonyl CoA-acyl carrier protein transacylase [Plasmodium brasilianum]|uniref:Malonyl CoA-acyl carrier protein transacylase, putative n=2 Tax=Plasmodium (Plasmodium) TaxID=418103 RepID=A0A1A8XAG6_PLAMA|nr:malonyl CoA-acyl carrier protein transacylase precursor, putative [Plasmodium malariae]KAI4834688.1 malonyl CoA-acyl carrier protein transacylase [Plasmodium brasilianum]SBT00815.1 malonyl CoA-acyl carrier protein transacylase precursor, putative [Plasmodium malariae]SBT80647.1 malonyl CoA-acyl carrier protein transacylase precursor, putative [Plasmodium malariae]SCP03233.1 malonyl CoA-acyl carrier protein transacylase precursor, putative [Plasmodium malariae]
MHLRNRLLLLLLVKTILWNSKNSESFILKRKETVVIGSTGNRNNKKNIRRRLIKEESIGNETEQILTSSENEHYIRNKLKEFEKYRIESYSSKYTFFFPGQGEQYISMGLDTYNNCKQSKEIYDRASKILGYNLMDVIKNGPIEKLKNSEIAQPSIYTVSIAAYEKLKYENNEALMKLNLCMGYSLGEYSALTCSESLPFEEGVYLTKERGKAMQNCAKLYDMTTVAIVGLTLDTIYKLIEDVNKEMKDDIFIVSYMTDKKFGLCGKPQSMEYLNKLAKEKYKAIFTKKLQISGAFHSSYMFPARKTLENVLNQINFKKLKVPVLSNVDGNAYDDPSIIKQLLLLQLTSPIKINSCLQNILKYGYECGYELGPGTINSNLLKDVSQKKKTAIPYI